MVHTYTEIVLIRFLIQPPSRLFTRTELL